MSALGQRPVIWVVIFGLVGVIIALLPRKATIQQDSLSLFEAKWNLGRMHMQQARIPMEGIQLLAKTAKEHPEHPEAAFQLGEMAMQTGQYNKAGSWYRTAFKNAGKEDKPVILMRLSDVYFAKKELDSCKWALKKIFDFSSDSVLLRTVNEQLNEINILSNK